MGAFGKAPDIKGFSIAGSFATAMGSLCNPSAARTPRPPLILSLACIFPNATVAATKGGGRASPTSPRLRRGPSRMQSLAVARRAQAGRRAVILRLGGPFDKLRVPSGAEREPRPPAKSLRTATKWTDSNRMQACARMRCKTSGLTGLRAPTATVDSPTPFSSHTNPQPPTH